MNTVIKAIKKWYYYPEFKTIAMLLLAVATVYGIYNYGYYLSAIIFSEVGYVYLAFSMMTLVLAIVIKIYFRILIIKYAEKDNSTLRLFQEKYFTVLITLFFYEAQLILVNFINQIICCSFVFIANYAN